MRNILMLIAIYIVQCCLAGTVYCATLTQDIQNTYAKMQRFSASFDQKLEHKESGGVENRKGSLLFQKPLLIRWETQKPNAELLVVNSKEIWNYLPDEEIAYRYSPDLVKDSRTLIQVITGQARLDKDFDVKDAGMDGNLHRLVLYPKEPTPQMVEGRIWVDPKNNLIQKATIIDFYGNTNTVAFTNITPDARIGKDSFSFTPPKGIEVEDNIGKKVEERTLFQ